MMLWIRQTEEHTLAERTIHSVIADIILHYYYLIHLLLNPLLLSPFSLNEILKFFQFLVC